MPQNSDFWWFRAIWANPPTFDFVSEVSSKSLPQVVAGFKPPIEALQKMLFVSTESVALIAQTRMQYPDFGSCWWGRRINPELWKRDSGTNSDLGVSNGWFWVVFDEYAWMWCVLYKNIQILSRNSSNCLSKSFADNDPPTGVMTYYLPQTQSRNLADLPKMLEIIKNQGFEAWSPNLKGHNFMQHYPFPQVVAGEHALISEKTASNENQH